MTVPVENVKNILAVNGLKNTGTSGNSLEELAQEICESVGGLREREELAQTIYSNLTASGVSFKDTDNLMGVAEDIAGSIYMSYRME
jgi:hypothetical protein